jgi:hypothetical protein
MATPARAAATRATAQPATEERSRLPISRTSDPGEREAQRLAKAIAPALARPAGPDMLARPAGRSALLPAAGRAGAGGQPVPPAMRAAAEARLGASLAGVRLHSDADAAGRAAAIGAAAFTIGGDIYFGAGRYQPDTPAGRELIAHELVHTVQQGGAVQRSAIGPVSEHVAPHVQRGALDWARDAGQWLGDKASAGIDAVKAEARAFFAARAASLPGYRLFKLATGRDPITGEAASASGAEVLRAIVGIVPLGDKVVQALDNHDIFEKGAAFIGRQAGALFDLASGIIADVRAFIGRLGVSDALRLGELWDEASALVVNSIRSVIDFLANLVSDFAALVKDAILKPLGAWAASKVPHWDLLTGVLGTNPVSEEGTSPGEQLIGAFMALIGQQEVWDNIRKSGAIGRAWAWFQGALGGARALVTSIPGRVKGIFTGLTIGDLLTLMAVFGRIAGAFASFVADFTRWGLGTVLDLLEIILSVVAPNALPYIKKAGGAFATILRNPIGFVGNLVAAGKQGFLAFAGNFLTHLKAGLIGWLTGSLAGAGVYIPQGFSARELLKFVASVLGLTWAQLRVRLVAAVGETAVVAMEAGFALVKTLVTEGPAAAWQQIIAAVGDLKAMAIDAVMDFVKSRIITVAITKLVMMLNPAGAFIQALLAIWNTINFFLERLAQIRAVAMRFIDSIAAIANGALDAAAARVEQTMAGMLVLVISFLARQANLGNVGQAVTGFIRRLRAPIERALDRVIGWVVAQARKLGRFVAQAGVPNDPQQRLRLAARDAVRLARPLHGRATEPVLTGALAVLRTRYALTSLTIRRQGQAWVAHIVINPSTTQVIANSSGAATPTASAAGPAEQPATAKPEPVPLPLHGWIMFGGEYEQVTKPAVLVARSRDGRTVPRTFMTARPSAGVQTRSYGDEGISWTRMQFIHPSQIVTPIGGGQFVLKPSRDGKYIRSAFYGDSQTVRDNIVNLKRPPLDSVSNPGMFYSDGDPARENNFGYAIDKLSGKALVPIGLASADHYPAIAAHWEKTGRNETQAQRTSWNLSPASYRIMSRKLNSGLSSGGARYRQFVGLTFRGPGE